MVSIKYMREIRTGDVGASTNVSINMLHRVDGASLVQWVSA